MPDNRLLVSFAVAAPAAQATITQCAAYVTPCSTRSCCLHARASTRWREGGVGESHIGLVSPKAHEVRKTAFSPALQNGAPGTRHVPQPRHFHVTYPSFVNGPLSVSTRTEPVPDRQSAGRLRKLLRDRMPQGGMHAGRTLTLTPKTRILTPQPAHPPATAQGRRVVGAKGRWVHTVQSIDADVLGCARLV